MAVQGSNGDIRPVVHSLDLVTGKLSWQTTSRLRTPVLRITGERISLTDGAKREVIDLKTGKLLEAAR